MTSNSSPPADWKADSQRFDGVADFYDTFRPGYPAELIEDIIRISGIQPDGKILEIGSGTGKATLPFAQRGYAILGLEPGQNLIAVAKRNLAAYPRVRFARARFEEWDADQAAFDLVISAQAYHWVPQELRYQRTAAVLRPHGHLAAFWNKNPGMAGRIVEELDQAYRLQAPELARDGTPLKQEIESEAELLRASPYFTNVMISQYPWSARYTTGEYLGLLNTYSDHLRLPPHRREALLHAVAEVIERNGGFFERPYLAVLYMAEKRS